MKFKSIVDWDESYLINEVLQPTGTDEYSWVDFKGKEIFKGSEFDKKIAKEISGFGNADGGYLIFGINDKTREIDGGIEIKYKNDIKQWIDQKIKSLTHEETTKFDSKLIVKSSNDSKISDECAIVVVEIPPHEKAPIQSAIDKNFYLRMASNTFPMTKQQIFDIANRQKYPEIQLSDFDIKPDDIRNDCHITMKAFLYNSGKIPGYESAIEIVVRNPIILDEIYIQYQETKHTSIEIIDRNKSEYKLLIRYKNTIFPDQRVPITIGRFIISNFNKLVKDDAIKYVNIYKDISKYKGPNLFIEYILYCDGATHKYNKYLFWENDKFKEFCNIVLQ